MMDLKTDNWVEAFSQVYPGYSKCPNVVVVTECSSTMDLAKEISNGKRYDALIKNEKSSQTAIFSLSQISGRGRKARVWESDKNGGMYFSFYDKQSVDIEHLAGLSLTVGLAIQDVLKKHEINAKLKWPNDVFVRDRKIAGILIETTIKNRKAQVIYGIGLNILQKSFHEVAKATSMFLELGHDLPYEKICAEITNSLQWYISIHQKNGFVTLKEKWWEESTMSGKTFYNEELGISGTAIGLNDDGALRVQVADGSVREIYVGDVS